MKPIDIFKNAKEKGYTVVEQMPMFQAIAGQNRIIEVWLHYYEHEEESNAAILSVEVFKNVDKDGQEVCSWLSVDDIKQGDVIEEYTKCFRIRKKAMKYAMKLAEELAVLS